MHPLEGSGPPADIPLVRLRLRKLRTEAGFGLIELLMAMTILNIGILAIVGVFNAGIVSLRRASQLSTASALADQQIELYRKITYDQIALDGTTLGTVDNTYKCDSALGGSCPNSTSSEVTQACTTPLPLQCVPSRNVTAATNPASPDRHNYRVDSYIVTINPTSYNTTPNTGVSRTAKLVTVVVRDGNNLGKVLARATSTFDCSTGQPYGSCPTS